MPREPRQEDDRTNWIPSYSFPPKSQDRVKGLNTGADVYMVKPFEPEELVALVEALKQAFRQQRQSNVNGDNEGTKSRFPSMYT